jgi:hypothetical protein
MEKNNRIAMNFRAASETVGMSKRYLEIAANDPDPQKHLKTVRISSRRLIRPSDLEDWFNRVARNEPQAA